MPASPASPHRAHLAASDSWAAQASQVGTTALAAVRTDIAEISSAIAAWDAGKPAQFVTILKRYLNDGRPKSAFAIAGATQCG